MKIHQIIAALEQLAPPSLQEDYDNAGLITGNHEADCPGALICLDATEAVIDEAIAKKYNLVIAHHPIIFRGLKKVTGKNYIERTIIKAIKHDIAIYAIHTNLDNVITGVNGMMADKLGLRQREILAAKDSVLNKLYTFVPGTHATAVRTALFAAGGGHIGNYSECSFNAEGIGTFKAGADTNPFVGEKDVQHQEPEIKIEVIFPAWLSSRIIQALKAAHPYEEVAYDIISLNNTHQGVGSGLIGLLEKPLPEKEFLSHISKVFAVPVIRHTAWRDKPVEKVALCGGAGSFLISKALALGADAFITADMKYHEFFDAEGRMIIADVGHYESEQFTIDLLQAYLKEKFPTFATLKTSVVTNPVLYFTGK